MKFTRGEPIILTDLELPDGAILLMMQWIKAGTATMGSPEGEPWRIAEDEEPFEAIISRGFWLGKYPVTQVQWEAVMGDNPSFFRHEGINRPVENVSWYDAMTFSERLSRRFGRDLPEGYVFSLPTEVQWEYACRAGTRSLYYSGNTEADLARIAWYAGNSNGQTHPVGEKEPNAWGLYDMQGNVGEWCFDSPSDYPKGQVVDWIGPEDNLLRIIRSGGWGTTYDEAGSFRSAFRGWGPPDTKRPWFGFRLCLR